MTSYQPEMIQRAADRLYVRAASAIAVSAVLGVLIGFAVDPFIRQSLPVSLGNALPDWASAAFLGGLGALQGWERAFMLKLQAQTALCQMRIESNTRPDSRRPADPMTDVKPRSDGPTQ